MPSPRLLPLLVLLAGAAAAPEGIAAAVVAVPAWLFPGEGDLPQPPYNTVTPLHLPDSRASYTEAQLFDQFAVPDWHPLGHPPLPDVVAHGVKPQVYACGYCHLANGRGRPENASLAGLPQPIALLRPQARSFDRTRLNCRGAVRDPRRETKESLSA